jgi:prepilin-type N-terminal cleavage/methylation domain-containing protein
LLSEGIIVRRLQKLIAPPDGFSFIELAVVIGIIGVIAIFSLPTFISFVQAQRTQGAARELVAMLNQARHLAITRNTPFSVEVQATPQGGQVRYCSGTATPCPGASVWNGPGTGANGWMTMANGDRIVLSPQITFSSLGAASTAGTLRVQNAEGSSCLDVIVSPAGRLRIAAAGACP